MANDFGAQDPVTGEPIIVDWQDQVLYDRADGQWGTSITAGQTKNYFTTRSSKTIGTDYLFHEDERMPQGWEYFVRSVGVMLELDCTVADAALILGEGWFEYRINDRNVREGAGVFHQLGFGITGTATATNVQTAVNGPVGTAQVDMLTFPIHLAGNKRHKGVYTFPAAKTLGAATYIYVATRGQIKRNV